MTSKVGGDAGVIMIDKNGKVEKYYSLRLIFEQWMPQFQRMRFHALGIRALIENEHMLAYAVNAHSSVTKVKKREKEKN